MARRAPRERGRITRLMEPGTHDRLVELTRAGAPLAVAAGAVGVSHRAFSTWLTRGRVEDERQADGHPPDRREITYHRLYREIMLARSLATIRTFAHVQKAAAGGHITEETTVTAPDGTVTKTVKIAPPDWRAGAWTLERGGHRGEFSKDPSQVEIIDAGPATSDDGQQQGGMGDLAARLAAQVAANMAATAGAITATAHDDEVVVDAEVVDPDAGT